MMPVYIMVFFYVFCTSLTLIVSKLKDDIITMVYMLNGAILCWVLYCLFNPHNSKLIGIMYDWAPLFMLPLLYRETALLTTRFGRFTKDASFIRFEQTYFPLVMRLHTSNRMNAKILSECLHACYLSFYVFIYGVPLYFYLKGEPTAFYASMFAILLVLFLSYLTHALCPVLGPRTLFDKINDHRSHGFFFRLVHRILEAGSTHGTAFPSGHVGVAAVVMLITWHFNVSLFLWVCPIAIGLIISTVYGRFHYLVDVIVGLLYAMVVYSVTVWLYPN